MTAGVFADCVFFLKLNNLSFKEKKHLKHSITSHGGSFSFVLNEKCTHVIASNASSLGSIHLKKIQKHCISLVNPEFIWKCIDEKQLLEESSDFEKPVDVILEKVKSVEHVSSKKNLQPVMNVPDTRDDIFDREYTFEEEELTSSEDTEVAKYCFLQKDGEVAVVELLCYKESHSLPFKISTCSGPVNGLQKEYSFYLAKDSEKACERYAWRINDLKNKGFLQKDDAPSQAIPFASDALQKVLLEETINTGTISREVGYFVESIWTDAQGHLSNILSCPVNNISINDVGVAEGILLQMKVTLAAQASATQMWVMMCEFYRLIPHISISTQEITMELLTKKQELCQLIRDMLNVCETTPSSRYPSSLAKYRALRCRIELLDKNTEEFVRLSKQLLQKNYSNESIEILNIYQVGRLSETCDFDSKLENVEPLLHATSPRNFVGILSRGLLMPKIITEEMGYNRTDVGNLGSGIYFTDSISTSVKYSEPSSTSGSRLLVVCDVALGKSKKVHRKDYTITEPPDGCHSVHGVRRTHGIQSDFEDDEFVVYKRSQIKMAYAVQFRTSQDIAVNLQPNVLSVELEETPEDSVDGLKPLDGSVIDDMCNENNIKGGLQNTQGEQIPLEKIYVKAKVMDLVAQVTLFQIYKNSSVNPIEAKYVFPLDSTAAVCGFEAFINGKHIVGEVKEKKQARQEYRSAIKEGHGAYLMDQDAPDAFTVSVGNLPPKATVIIKITYIMEVEVSYGSLIFKIPGAVASWQKDTAIKENTQDTVTKVGIDQDGVPEGCFSLQMSIELPYKIDSIQCHTHEILKKKTDCKAVIQTKEGCSFSDAGFQLFIEMENPYVPRMWVEKHPEKDSEACMLVFQPEFPNTLEDGDVTICLDCSNSMKPCFQNAQLLALYLASSVFCGVERNVVLFGSSYKEFEFYPRSNLKNTEELETFIKMAKPNMGGTEFWKPLHSLGLLPRNTGLHNLILISDGHLQNERHIIQSLKKNVGKIRLFTCGVGATAKRHLLRRLSLLGNGTFDFFDTKTKSKWKDQMQSLYIKLFYNKCTSVSLKWTRHNQPDQELSQAPAKLPPIFSHGRLLVYGFIRHCTQATLKALIEDKEMETMVSTTEFQKTTGTMLHKLTARALIRDYEDGILHEEEDENEMQKQLRKSEIINLSKEYSIVTQFTSFIAVEKRDADEQQDVEPNILEIISPEDVDFLPYMDWQSDVTSSSDSDDVYGSTDSPSEEKIKDCIAVEDSQDITVEEDELCWDCADPFPISPQDDLKDTVRSSFSKKKRQNQTLPGLGNDDSDEDNSRRRPGSEKAGLFRTDLSLETCTQTKAQSRKTIFLRRKLNEEEDAPFRCAKASALRLSFAPAAPIGFGSSLSAILGPKPFEQAIDHEKKPEVQLLGAPLGKTLLSPSFQSSLTPKRAGAALFGSSTRGLSRQTDLREHMFPQTSIFSSSMPSPSSSFIQEMPTGEPPRADLKLKDYQSETLQKDQISPQMEPLSLVTKPYRNRSGRGRSRVYEGRDAPIFAKEVSPERFKSSSPPSGVKYDSNIYSVEEKFRKEFGGVASLEETSQPPSSQIQPASIVSLASAAPSSAYFRPFDQPAGGALFGSSTIGFSRSTTSQPHSFSQAMTFSNSMPPLPLFTEGKPAGDQPSADHKVPQFGASFGIAAPSLADFRPFARPAPRSGALFGSTAFGFSSVSTSQQPDSLFSRMALPKSISHEAPIMLQKKSVGQQSFADLTLKDHQSETLQKDQISPPMEPLSLATKPYRNRSGRGRSTVYEGRDAPIFAKEVSPERFKRSSPPSGVKYDRNIYCVEEKFRKEFGGAASLEETSQPASIVSLASAAPSSAYFRPFDQAATGGGELFGSSTIGFSRSTTSRPHSFSQAMTFSNSMPPLPQFTEGKPAGDQPSADIKVPQFGESFCIAAPSSADFRPFARPAPRSGALFGSSAFGFSSVSTSQHQDLLFSHMALPKSMPREAPILLQKKSVGQQSFADLTEDGSSPKTKPFYRHKLKKAALKRIPPSWADLSVRQTKEGFWMLTSELGKILEINVPFLIDVFLMKKGIFSLGSRGKDDVCGLIATLLVLQAIRFHNLVNSINFKSLLKLDESSCTSESYPYIENAIKWARKVDQQYPGICVRLGLGKDWDFVTKQLLRIEPMEASSELQPALGII